jgi:hypothetical protein
VTLCHLKYGAKSDLHFHQQASFIWYFWAHFKSNISHHLSIQERDLAIAARDSHSSKPLVTSLQIGDYAILKTHDLENFR